MYLPKRIYQYLEKGHTIAEAANLCGIGERAYHDWNTRGFKGMNPTRPFLMPLRARDRFKSQLIRKIAASSDWRALAFLLERRFPSDFGTKQPESEFPNPRPHVAVVDIGEKPSIEDAIILLSDPRHSQHRNGS